MMRALVILALAFGAACLQPTPAAAQTRADSAAVLLDAARRIEAEGRRDAAQALYAYIVRHYAGTPAADVIAGFARRPDPTESFSAGRTELIVGGTAYGIWLGIAVPLALGADSPEPFGIGLLLGGPAGFFASRAYANRNPLTEGQARAITFGGTWGTWQGLGWSEVLELGVRHEPCPWNPQEVCAMETGGREKVGAMIAGGLAGIATGAVLARRPIRAGTATAVSFAGPWGTWYGFGTSVLAGLDDDERATWALALIGGNAAIVGTALVADRMQISRERARLISIAGVAGGLAGAGLNLILQPSEDRVIIGIPLLTSAAGLIAGTIWTRDHDPRAR